MQPAVAVHVAVRSDDDLGVVRGLVAVGAGEVADDDGLRGSGCGIEQGAVQGGVDVAAGREDDIRADLVGKAVTSPGNTAVSGQP